MIRLGHIRYSNCYPVHARVADGAAPPGIEVVHGLPSELNDQLAQGQIDVAPCSSIEYARHQLEYRVLPELAIASDGPVQSILVESVVPLAALAGCEVLVPTASATSVVLLRILLEQRYGLGARLRWFDQSADGDPFETGAAAALWIGDVALTRRAPVNRYVHDLGELWAEWTGLPFTYALWQARAATPAAELAGLHAHLLESRAYFYAHAHELAARNAASFGIEAARLERYWCSLRYTLDARTTRGLLHFFRLAAELGEAPHAETIGWADV